MGEKIFCRLWLALTFILLFWIVRAPHGTWIESENRPYAEFTFASPDTYFTDRLPMRERLLRLNRDIVLALGKNEFAGAFLGEDGYLFSEEETSTETLAKNLDALQNFSDTLAIPVHTAVVGAKQDVLFGSLPRLYADDRAKLWQMLASIKMIDLLPTLRTHGGEGKYIYYRGDHHLTSLGCYYVYHTLAQPLGITSHKDFSVSVVNSDFSGSDARKMLTNTGDRIALFRFKGDGDLRVENMDSGKERGLYDYEALHAQDPYAVFPIADCGRVRITYGDRPKLLVLCDSYGDALAPFLARHFDLDMIDPRYYGGSVMDLAKENNYTAVLVYFGMDTLAGREVLYKLNF